MKMRDCPSECGTVDTYIHKLLSIASVLSTVAVHLRNGQTVASIADFPLAHVAAAASAQSLFTVRRQTGACLGWVARDAREGRHTGRLQKRHSEEDKYCEVTSAHHGG